MVSRLAAALAVSLLLHTSLFGIVQVGSLLGWWETRPFSMFSKVRVTPEELMRLAELQRRQEEARREMPVPTIFVQVTESSDEPVPDTPFYGAHSSQAANPVPGEEAQPRLEGRQTESMRLQDAPRMATGVSTPPPPPPEAVAREATPEPVRPPPRVEPVQALETPALAQAPPEPARPLGIGDLALARPEVRVPEPEPEVEKEPMEVPPPVVQQPVPRTPTTVTTQEPTPPPRARPRTVTEARLRQNLMAGEVTKMEGGVPRQGSATVSVQGTGFGAYDEAMFLAVQNRWYFLLDERRFAGSATGRVVLRFRLYMDGTVRLVEPTETTVDPLMTSLCLRAVTDPAPYQEWPSDMRRMIGSNYREIRVTFIYN